MQKNNQIMPNNDLLKLATMQNELDNIYEEKTLQKQLRLRRKWMGWKHQIFFQFIKKKSGNNLC